MNRISDIHARLGWLVFLAAAPLVQAQKRPYIGYVYPAGGQQSTTTQIRLGGQDLDDVNSVLVTGTGVTARVVEYFRRLNNQEVQLLNEQLKELKNATATAPAMAPAMAAENPAMMQAMPPEMAPAVDKDKNDSPQDLIERIERRVREAVQTPACASLSSLVMVEVTITSDAPPGSREMRLVTPRGVTNPLRFQVGQVPESSRKPMISATLQVLGKEATALRKRPPEEAEETITLPCTVNGQIASGEINRYRFHASKGQRLVLSTQARQLIPFIADAVPGWFQPVLGLYDATGRELAYSDDYRFNPDPVILYQIPADGDYVFAIYDAIYRGREDFVYRITAGELPLITSIFPLGGPATAPPHPQITGWGLDGAKPDTLPPDNIPGIVSIVSIKSGMVSNPAPFALATLPEVLDHEPNNTTATAQKVTLPVIINGRIDRPDDWDVFQFDGKADDPLVIEVQARKLDSPLDSVIKLTDASGNVLAFNDDREDLTAATNTHHADSYLLTKLPADGTYFVHIGDTARNSGDEYAYRLRISAPLPDFELRVVPSSAGITINSSTTLSVYAMRKDGFTGPIMLALKDPPQGFTATPVTIAENQLLAKFTIKGGPTPSSSPVPLAITGTAIIDTRETTRQAVPAEDRMQAFLWRHLIPATDLLAMVSDPKYQAPPKRVPPLRPLPFAGPPPPAPQPLPLVGPPPPAGYPPPKPKSTKSQIEGRLKQLKSLYQEGLLTDPFYDTKVTECEAAQ